MSAARESLFPLRALRSAWGLFKAARRGDDRFHTFCRECGYEVPESEAYYSKDEQREKFGEGTLLIRYPKKDCPHCGAKHVPGSSPNDKSFYEPLYGLPPRDMALRLAHGELRRVYRIEKLYAYPDGHGAEKREVIRRFWGRTLSARMEENVRG